MKYCVAAGLLGAMTNFVSGTVIGGPFVNPSNGHSYYLLAPTTWASAQSEAVSLGGNLATINDAAEDTWVVTELGDDALDAYPSSVFLLIGLNDQAAEGSYVWASGESSSYLNWDSNSYSGLGIGPQPNGTFNTNEDAVGIATRVFTVGRWHDLIITDLGGAVPVVEAIPEPSSLLPCIAAIGMLRRRRQR